MALTVADTMKAWKIPMLEKSTIQWPCSLANSEITRYKFIGDLIFDEPYDSHDLRVDRIWVYCFVLQKIGLTPGCKPRHHV